MSKKNYTPRPPQYRPGDIGYRNRGGQSGLDPFDSSRELSRLEGVFIRHLIRGTLRVRNPFTVLVLLTVGSLLVAAVVGMASGMSESLEIYSFGSLVCVVPIMILLAGIGLMMVRAGISNAARMSGLTRWWGRQFNKGPAKEKF